MDVYKVKASSLNVRSGPGTAHNIVATLSNGKVINVDSISGNWAHTPDYNGYASMSYLTLVSKGEASPTPSSQDTTSQTQSNQNDMELTDAARRKQEIDIDSLEEEIDEKNVGYIPEWPAYAVTSGADDDASYLSNINNNLSVTDCRGIHGMPHQFLPIVDTRVDSKIGSFGRKFADKIVSKMPVMVVTPGTPIFLKDYSQSDKRSMLTKLLIGGNDKSDIDRILGREGKYYSLKFDYKGYYEYVNPTLRIIAKMMDIDREYLNGVRLSQFDWGADIEADLSNILNYTNGIAFYIDSEKQIQESFSTSTTNSMLKDSINGLSDYGRELQFLLGSGQALSGINLPGAVDSFTSTEGIQKNFENVNDFVNNVLMGNGNIFGRLTKNIGTLVGGGKLVFPEIWSDSEFSRSYSVRMKFISPDPSPMSLYLNIMVPLILCICLAAPRESGVNGYISPYLIKAYYKSMFNVDLGIITGLGIRKGEEGHWTRSGIPTVVEVDMEIKDLYSSFSISNTMKDSNIFNNTILMDYLATMCGINLNEPDIYRQVSYYMSTNSISNARDAIRYDVFRGLEQWKDNTVYSLYDRFFR